MLSTAFIVLVSCAPARLSYLPEIDAVGLSPFGAYISLQTKDDKSYNGELIALEGKSLTIGCPTLPELDFVDTTDVKKFFIQTYKYKSFAISNVLPLSHGLWMVFTYPLNVAISSSLRYADKKESRYYNIDFNSLTQYSRYPSGFPEGFSFKDYKPAIVEK